EFQRELASAAGRATAWVRAVLAWREDAARQSLVEGVEYLGNAQILDFVGRAGEILPEIAQHLLVVELTVGNFVELFFQPRREAVFDIACEEIFEEGGDDAAAILGMQRLALEADIVAVLEGGEGRR